MLYLGFVFLLTLLFHTFLNCFSRTFLLFICRLSRLLHVHLRNIHFAPKFTCFFLLLLNSLRINFLLLLLCLDGFLITPLFRLLDLTTAFCCFSLVLSCRFGSRFCVFAGLFSFFLVRLHYVFASLLFDSLLSYFDPILYLGLAFPLTQFFHMFLNCFSRTFLFFPYQLNRILHVHLMNLHFAPKFTCFFLLRLNSLRLSFLLLLVCLDGCLMTLLGRSLHLTNAFFLFCLVLSCRFGASFRGFAGMLSFFLFRLHHFVAVLLDCLGFAFLRTPHFHMFLSCFFRKFLFFLCRLNRILHGHLMTLHFAPKFTCFFLLPLNSLRISFLLLLVHLDGFLMTLLGRLLDLTGGFILFCLVLNC